MVGIYSFMSMADMPDLISESAVAHNSMELENSIFVVS